MRPLQDALLELLAVAVAGLALALLANQLSPRGLALTRNYFPAPAGPPVVSPRGTNQTGPSAAQGIEARILQRGLGVVHSNDVAQLFQDPRHAQGLIVFVDARNEAHYRAGHVPGAVLFDHYRPEQYLPTVLPLAQVAEKIIVYCTGGACEDSEFAAAALGDAGVPKDRLFVYVGGIDEWSTQGLPVELGERHSGQLRPSPR